MTRFMQRLTMPRLALAILFVLLFAMAVRTPTDTDTWWHIRSGEYIVQERAIPTTDPFSHTRNGSEWIDHGWGSQVVLYGVYDLFGGSTAPGDSGNIGLALYTAVLATLGMVFVYRMCEGNVYVKAFAIIIATSTAAIFWSARPQMFSFALGAVVLYILHLYKREHINRLWVIPPIMALWANLHGGFAIGFIFLFGSLAGELLGNLFDPEREEVVSWSRMVPMVGVTVLSMAAIVLNPHGVTLLYYPFKTVGIGALQDFIQEWASPDFHNPATWPFIVLLLGVLAAVGLSNRRLDWTDLVLVSGTAFLALTAGRNIAVFAIAATPVLTRHVATWLDDRGWQIRSVSRVRGLAMWVNWILLAVVVLGAVVKIAVAVDAATVRKAQAQVFPVELAAYLAQSPPPGLMFNTYNWGGYLMFAAPDVPVYVDGRTDLYDDAFLRDYLDISLIREGWAEKLDEQDISFVAIDHDTVLATMLREHDDQWRELVFDDGQSSLFVRIDSQ